MGISCVAGITIKDNDHTFAGQLMFAAAAKTLTKIMSKSSCCCLGIKFIRTYIFLSARWRPMSYIVL